MKAYTDCPFETLGDIPYKEAPIRECEILSYDGDKYCKIIVAGETAEVKGGYIYSKPGRCGEVRSIGLKKLNSLPKY